ncbi:hypothetical protein BH11PSE11_BH11PSE11_18150 [soil metagenome]
MHIRPFISLLLAAAVGPHAIAADGDGAPKPVTEQDSGPKSYIGEHLRLGIGYDTKTKLRGEYYQVLQEDAAKAFISEAWVSGSAAGFKLNHHWLPQSAQADAKPNRVNKLFVALDQNEQHDRKFTVGGGAEYSDWFWGSYLSHGLTARRQVSGTTVSSVTNATGVEGGRSFNQQTTTAVTTNIFERPYDYGIGVMAGQFYDPALLRVYARLDHEWGRSSASQDTIGVGVEKFFANSPISVALNAEAYRKSGDFEPKQNDQRVNLVVRYEFGGKSYRSDQRETRRVAVAPSVAADTTPAVPPATSGAVVAAPPPTTATGSVTQLDSNKKTEMRMVKTTASMSADAFFDFDKAIVTPAAQAELDGVIARLKSSGYTGNVRLTGHTCNIGTDAYNLRLSERRAAAVKAYMAAHGVPADTIIVEGKGEAEPRFPNNTAASRQKNRRVDLEFVTYVDKMQEVVVAQEGKPDAVKSDAAVVKSDAATAKPAAVEWRTETIESEPAWVRRALHNTIRHKQTVDVYRQVEQTTTVTTGARVFVNRAPLAVNDSFQVLRNSSTNLLDVLANDSDPDSEPFRLLSVQSPAHGSATISGNRIAYTPTAGYQGGDLFTYTITDDKGGTATASVTILVSANAAASTAPIAVNDAFTVIGNSTNNLFDVLKNDSDPDGDPIRVTSVKTPAHGIVSISGNGIAYTPTAGYIGPDSFTYTITDSQGLSATATVNVTVSTPNLAPLARDDESWVIWGQPIRIYVLANDVDPNGDPLTITSIGPVANGKAVINGDNIIYTSNSTFTGRETFTYTISDGRGLSATATVRVTVVDP